MTIEENVLPYSTDDGTVGQILGVRVLIAICGATVFCNLALSIGLRSSSTIWHAWPVAVWLVHIVGMIVVLGATGWSLSSLGVALPGPARPIAALGRYAILFGLIGFVCSWGLESQIPAGVALQFCVRALRAALVFILPLWTMMSLGLSRQARRFFGNNVLARVGDYLLQSLSRDGAVSILLMLGALLLVLFSSSLPSIKEFGLGFLYKSEWRAEELPGQILKDDHGKPIIDDGEMQRGPPTPPVFGALPVIYGTFVSSIISLLVAVPLSFGAALFLIRISPDIKPLVVRAGIAGLLLVLTVPKLIAASGDIKASTGLLVAVVAAVILCIAAAEVLVFLANKVVGSLRAGEVVPIAYELAAQALVCLLSAVFARAYFGDAFQSAAFYGFVAGLLFYPVATYFTATVSFLIEFLAAIPSLAYGMWGMLVLAVFLQADIEPIAISALRGFGIGVQSTPIGRDMMCGGLLLGIMIIPIITAISRDVLRAVPSAQVEGTTALGATWWQSSIETLKFSRSALFGAVMLGLARAAGETMAVTMVIGNSAKITGLTEEGAASRVPNLFAPAQTMASLLANEFGEAGAGSLHFSALMYVAFVLLLMSLVFNVVARYFVVGKSSRSAAAH